MKNQIKVRKHIARFYEHIKKSKLIKISDDLLKDGKLMGISINNEIKHLDKNPSWCRNLTIQIARDGDDFIRALHTIKIDYTYPKYGNC